MYAHTWPKLQLCIHSISKESLRSTASTFTCLLPRKLSWGGLFTSARTWPVHYSMLGAQQMYAPGGPAPRRPAWTKTTLTLVSISILCLVVQVGQVTCHTSGGHLLTLWTLQWSSWREQDTRGEQSVGVMNVKNWKVDLPPGHFLWWKWAQFEGRN